MQFHTHIHFVRCRDSAGNVNEDDYVLSFQIADEDPGSHPAVIAPMLPLLLKEDTFPK